VTSFIVETSNDGRTYKQVGGDKVFEVEVDANDSDEKQKVIKFEFAVSARFVMIKP